MGKTTIARNALDLMVRAIIGWNPGLSSGSRARVLTGCKRWLEDLENALLTRARPRVVILLH